MKISGKRVNRILVFICMLLLLTPLAAFAQNKVVVIPLFDGSCTSGTCKPLKNIVTVAKAGGMYTDPVAAVASITNASEINPYLVVIGPGVYTVTMPVVMKPWVDIAGSGENVTKIKGAISTGGWSTSAIVKGANHAVLSFLTVENTGGSTYSSGIYNGNASPSMTHITAMGTGATIHNYGVYNESSSPVMTNVTATATGGSQSYGVCNSSSSPVMTNVTATATGGATYNIGVYNEESSSPVMTNVTATATGGTNSYGVGNYSSSPVIRRSSMKGDKDGLYSEYTGTTTVSQSTIIMGVGGPGAKTCVACDNGFSTALDVNCGG